MNVRVSARICSTWVLATTALSAFADGEWVQGTIVKTLITNRVDNKIVVDIQKRCNETNTKQCCQKGAPIPQNKCLMFGVSLGQSPFSLLDEDLRLVYNELTAGSRLYTPSGLRLVAGAAIHQVSREATSKGVPKWVVVCDEKGTMRGFGFDEGASTALVKAGAADYAAESVTMLDANGWATSEAPTLYEYSDPKGRLFRFGADPSDPETYLQLVSVRFPGGRIETGDDIGFEILRDAEGTPRQIVGPAKIAVLPDAPAGEVGYDIVLYPNDASTTSWQRDAAGFYVLDPAAEPLVTWRVRNPEPETDLVVDLSKVVGDSSPVTWRFVYNTELEDFSLEYPDGAMKSFSGMYYNEDRSSVIVEKYNVIDGEKSSHEISEFHRYGDTYRRVSKTRDPDGLALRSEYAFYDDATRYGLEKSVVYEDGSWERFDYDASRRLFKKVSPWLDSALADSDDASVCTTYDYAPFLASDVVRWNDTRPRVEITRTTGIETSRFYYAYPTNEIGRSQSIKEQAGAQNAPYGDPRNRRWTTEFYGPADGAFLHGRVAVETDFTGWTAAHTYERGFVNLATYAFVPDPGGDAWRETILRTKPGAMTRRFRSVRTAQGNEVLSTEEGLHESGEWIPLATVKMAYDRNGNLIRKETQDGRVEEWSYGLNCCGMESHTTWDGRQFVYEYDQQGNRIRETRVGLSPDGADSISTVYLRRPDGLLLSVMVTNVATRDGFVTDSYRYDAAGREIWHRDRNGREEQTVFSGPRIVSFDQVSSSEQVRYRDGRLKSMSQADVVRSLRSYTVSDEGCLAIRERKDELYWQETSENYFGEIVSVRAERPSGGSIAQCYELDSFGHVLSMSLVEVSEQGDESLLQNRVFSYDDEGNQSVVCLDADGNGSIDYDGNDYIEETERRFVRETDGWWEEIVRYAYPENAATNRIETFVERLRLSGEPFGLVAERGASRDSLWRLSVFVSRPSKSVGYSVQKPESTHPEQKLECNGLLVETVDSFACTNRFDYDGLGRLCGERTARGTVRKTFAWPFSETTIWNDRVSITNEFDVLGRRVSVTDSLGRTSRMQYDAFGNVTNQSGAVPHVSFGYDKAGRLTMHTTYACETNPVTTRFELDAISGRTLLEMRQDGSAIAFDYDGAGRLVSRLSARGVRSSYDYDALGRLLNVTHSDSTPGRHFRHDRLGRVVAAWTDDGITNTYAYAGASAAPILKQTPLGDVVRDFDSAGRCRSISAPFGYLVSTTFDPLGRIESLQTGSERFDFDWTTNGFVGEVRSTGGFWRRTDYEPLSGSVVRLHTGMGNETVGQYAYGSDAMGRRLAENGWLADVFSVSNRWQYDDLDQVAREWIGGNEQAFCYDGNGNRTESLLGEGSSLYQNNALDQMTNLVVSGAGIPLTYDADGNMTKDEKGLSYDWDAENRLARVFGSDWELRYKYDVEGRVVEKIETRNGAVVREDGFLWDDNRIIQHWRTANDSTNCAQFVWGPDGSGADGDLGGVGGLLVVNTFDLDDLSSTTSSFPVFDGRGNITGYVNTNGAVLAAVSYDSFGVFRERQGPVADYLFWFSTQPFEFRTGKVEYLRRNYIPTVGQWMSCDPLGIRAGNNLYSFVRNNPVNAVDLFGLDCHEWSLLQLSPPGGGGKPARWWALDDTLWSSGKTFSFNGSVCDNCCDDGRLGKKYTGSFMFEKSWNIQLATWGGAKKFDATSEGEVWGGLKADLSTSLAGEGSFSFLDCDNPCPSFSFCFNSTDSLSLSLGGNIGMQLGWVNMSFGAYIELVGTLYLHLCVSVSPCNKPLFSFSDSEVCADLTVATHVNLFFHQYAYTKELGKYCF